MQEALDRAAVIHPTPAVVLRGGTHFVSETLVLTPAHSGLHLIGYPGEAPEVSGGVELTGLAWKKYSPSKPPAPAPTPAPPTPTGWVEQDNYNYVFNCESGSADFPLYGKLQNKTACAAACKVGAAPALSRYRAGPHAPPLPRRARCHAARP